MTDDRAPLCQHSRHLLRWLLSLGAPEPSVKAGEQMAAMTLYSTEERRKRVRAVPSRRGYHPRRKQA